VINKMHALIRLSLGVSASVVLLSAGVIQAAEYSAVLDWSGRVALTLPVSGVLDNVSVQAGQVVKKGELLASIDPALFRVGVVETRADMDRLAEESADAKRDLDRVQELYSRTVASTTELDAAKLRFARASSGLAASQARVERARRLLADSELRAPFDAVVLTRQAEPGLVITSQCQPAAVLSVARADELVARAMISAAQAASIRLGAEAEVLVAESSLKGRVRSLSSGADYRYSLEVALPRNAGLLVGQSATIRLP
jgi:RND family efflux transporter MFP subunit